jgi:hypothetical protein
MGNFRLAFSLLTLLFLGSCAKDKDETVKFAVYQSSGDISAVLNQFRNVLGNLNTTPGALSGRREINWDGVPDSLLNKALPKNFFNQVGDNVPASLQRGLAYDEGEFQVSATKFSHVNNDAASQFSSFSGNKIFANLNNDLWPIGFEIAGQATPAAVKAFGMVFSDVDLDNSTSLEFFEGNVSLGKFFVPAHDANSNFSFLGVYFHNRNVTRILVQHQGRLADGQKDISQGGSKDLVVMDDLIYSEPIRR